MRELQYPPLSTGRVPLGNVRATGRMGSLDWCSLLISHESLSLASSLQRRLGAPPHPASTLSILFTFHPIQNRPINVHQNTTNTASSRAKKRANGNGCNNYGKEGLYRENGPKRGTSRSQRFALPEAWILAGKHIYEGTGSFQIGPMRPGICAIRQKCELLDWQNIFWTPNSSRFRCSSDIFDAVLCSCNGSFSRIFPLPENPSVWGMWILGEKLHFVHQYVTTGVNGMLWVALIRVVDLAQYSREFPSMGESLDL